MQARTKKILLITGAVLLVIGIVAGLLGYSWYKKIMLPNVAVEKDADIFVTTGATLDDILLQINADTLLLDAESFEWWAKQQHLGNNLKPGRYIISHGMSNRAIVNLLMSGNQTPVRVTFNNQRTVKDLAGRIGSQLETDSADLLAYFDTTKVFAAIGLNKDNFMTAFIPNTYEFYWNTSAAGFTERMIKEHDNFWNDVRKKKAEALNLTPAEVYILASIVYSENEKAADEAPRIAGVYMNRLQKGMKLEADPTVKFAIGDFTIKRILFADLEIDSPYNTYKYAGLPPGPIHMPPVAYIDAVLNYEKHDYIFMCASGDGSGYHLFAETLAEHNRNRDIYIKTLNKQGIRR